jgi:DNA-binding XRE family transcriptional regulator
MKPEILKLIRSKLDLTQKQVSEIIEVSDKT